jgi:hypothetical protein
MNRRQGVLSLLLVVAALSAPAAGASRPVDSLRLVISIAWINGDQANAERLPAARTTRRSPAAAIVVYPPIQSQARSTALPPHLFQRPPPVASLAS